METNTNIRNKLRRTDIDIYLSTYKLYAMAVCQKYPSAH